MEIIRLKQGDEVVGALTERVRNLSSGIIIALGALSEATLKVYDLNLHKYNQKTFSGNLEVSSFTALISKNPDGKIGIHPHIVVGDQNFQTYCGHLESGIVSATFEAVIFKSENELSRKYSEEIGLNLLNI